MKKLLALSFFPAFLPPRSGGEVRLFALYNALSQTHRVVLLTSGHVGGEVETLQHNANFREIRVPKGPEFAQKWAELQEHAGSGDLSAPCLAALAGTLSELHRYYLLEYPDSDVIIHDSPFLSGYDVFMGFDNKPRIYNSYNVEIDVYRQIHKEAVSSKILDIVRHCEENLLRHADIVTACSQDDIELFSKLYFYDGEIRLVPNGIDDFAIPKPKVSGNDVVFIGSAHRPNVVAAEFIATKLAPALPEYQFHIIGTCLAPERSQGNLVVHGPVDEAAKLALFQNACASVNPMEDGGGSSLKIVDLAASGVPILSTTMGVRGFGMVDGTHYLSFSLDTASDDISRHLADVAGLERSASLAAEHIKSCYTWSVIAASMAEVIADACAGQIHSARFAVLNDYDPYTSIGGGATRIRGLYQAVSEEASVILLCFTDEQELLRREECDGRVLVIAVPKTVSHRAAEADACSLYHVSAADILAIKAAPDNPWLSAIADCAASISDMLICEHPYMVGLAHRNGARFVYSSQNFELQLKRDLLDGHPLYEQLMEDLLWAESYAVGGSDLVVAVSDDDARALGAAFPMTAPVVVVPNGANEPNPVTDELEPLDGVNVVFVGSAHMPNIEAARFITDRLAPLHPEITFHLLGSVCLGLAAEMPDNIITWGVVEEQVKADVLARCDLALNPMLSGSGSNVKVADYLKNGLAVLSTPFGARGYDDQVGQDIVLSDLDDFSGHLERLSTAPSAWSASNTQRRAAYVGKLSMYASGQLYAQHLSDKLIQRKRVAFVTYRYNEPAMGGAEAHLQRLIQGLADAGHDVDVITTTTQTISDEHRFSSTFHNLQQPSEIPVGNARIRCAKFPTEPSKITDDLVRLWAVQPHYERALHNYFEPHSGNIGLSWGWAPESEGGRWCYNLFGLTAQAGDLIALAGFTPGQRLLRITGQSGVLVGQWSLSGEFSIEFTAIGERVHGQFYAIDEVRPADVRPLAAYFRTIRIGSKECVFTAPSNPWPADTDASAIFAGHQAAARATRYDAGVSLTDVRGPHSKALESYLQLHLSDYDLLLTHNAVFKTATRSIFHAKKAGVPSVLVPLLHLDDDYYHFPDIYSACELADLTLVSPQSACTHLRNTTHARVKYHTPGVDLIEKATPDDIERFRTCYRHDEPYFLILGRKAGAKRYRDVIAAAAEVRKTHPVRVVMIGVDEDGEDIFEPFVTYLGQVDRSVVRGALAGCVALANMSTSESFGMVLVEAGLAKAPVLANINCAPFHDIVTDGEQGYLVTPDTLAAKMIELLENPKERARMGRAGADRARAFVWDTIVQTFVDDCEDLMSKAANK